MQLKPLTALCRCQPILYLLQPVLLTPLLWIFWFQYCTNLTSPLFVFTTFLENALWCKLIFHMRRWWRILAFLLTIVHSFIVTMDLVTLYCLRGPIDAPLFYNMITTMEKNKGSVTDANRLAPIFFIATFIFELITLFGPTCGSLCCRPCFSCLKVTATVEYEAVNEEKKSSSKKINSTWSKCLTWWPAVALPIYIFLCILGNYSPLSNLVVTFFQYSSLRKKENNSHTGSLGKCNSAMKGVSFEPQKSKAAKPPNLIFIMNESLGNHVFKTPEAIKKSPFFHEELKTKDYFYDFTNARSCGANTRSAAPAAFTGYFIATEMGSPNIDEFFRVPSLTCIAERLNYTTAAFSAYDTHYEDGWKELNGVFDQYDTVVSKTTLNAETVNDMGMDDRILTKHILSFLDEQNEDQPFYLLIVWNNNHTPFLDYKKFQDGSVLDSADTYLKQAVHATSITDQMLSQVYKKLEEKKLADNTVIGSVSDHGESAPIKSVRVRDPSSNYLGNPFWIHAPDRVLSYQQKQMLRKNEKALVSNLDMVPTLIDVMGWMNSSSWFKMPSLDSMVHGQSLLDPVDTKRIVPGWQGEPFVGGCEWNFGYLSNETFNLIVKPLQNEILLEQVDEEYYTRVQQSWKWKDLTPKERQHWRGELERYPHMLRVLRKCGLRFFD